MAGTEWTDLERAEAWPSFRERLPHAADTERMLVEHLIQDDPARALDLGCGDGHMIALLRQGWPDAEVIGLDLSPALLEEARRRFKGDQRVAIEAHDLMQPFPGLLGQFDLVVSALAIHHLPDRRKAELFGEVFELLGPGGVFYDLDVVAAQTAELHALSQSAFGFDERQQDPL